MFFLYHLQIEPYIIRDSVTFISTTDKYHKHMIQVFEGGIITRAKLISYTIKDSLFKKPMHCGLKCALGGSLGINIFSRMLRDSTPRFVGPSIRRSVRHTLLFLGFCGFWPRCSFLNDLVTSITAPAHPHATGVAVYPALFPLVRLIFPSSEKAKKENREKTRPDTQLPQSRVGGQGP